MRRRGRGAWQIPGTEMAPRLPACHSFTQLLPCRASEAKKRQGGKWRELSSRVTWVGAAPGGAGAPGRWRLLTGVLPQDGPGQDHSEDGGRALHRLSKGHRHIFQADQTQNHCCKPKSQQRHRDELVPLQPRGRPGRSPEGVRVCPAPARPPPSQDHLMVAVSQGEVFYV